MKQPFFLLPLLLSCLGAKAQDEALCSGLTRLIEAEWELATREFFDRKKPSLATLRTARKRAISDIITRSQQRLPRQLMENLMVGPKATIRSNWLEVRKALSAPESWHIEVGFVPAKPFSKPIPAEVAEPVIGRVSKREKTPYVRNGSTNHLQVTWLSSRNRSYREFLGGDREFIQVPRPGEALLDETVLRQTINRIKRSIRIGTALFGQGTNAEATALTMLDSADEQDVLVPYFWSRAGHGLTETQLRTLVVDDALAQAAAASQDLQDKLFAQTREVFSYVVNPDVHVLVRSRFAPVATSRQPLGVLGLNSEYSRDQKSRKRHPLEKIWVQSTLEKFGNFLRRRMPERFAGGPGVTTAQTLIRLAGLKASEIRSLVSDYLRQQYFFDLHYSISLALRDKQPVSIDLIEAVARKFRAAPESDSPEWLWHRCQHASLWTFTDLNHKALAVQRRIADEVDLDTYWSANERLDIANAVLSAGQQELLAGNALRSGEIAERALKLAPDYYLAHFYRARAYLNSGHTEAALKHFEKALALTEDQQEKNTMRRWITQTQERSARQGKFPYRKAARLYEIATAINGANGPRIVPIIKPVDAGYPSEQKISLWKASSKNSTPRGQNDGSKRK